jgi:glycerophosphoryl diester phosphodiesterase
VPDFQIVGHRGNGAGSDENTLVSCLSALKNGATRLEVDVRLEGKDVATGHDSQDRADTLDNVLEGTSAPLLLHVKEGGRDLRPFSRKYYRALIDLTVPKITDRQNVTLLSAAPGALRYAKRRYPNVRTAFATLWGGYDLFLAKSLGASELWAWHRTTTRAAVKHAGRIAMPFGVYVAPGNLADLARLEKIGVTRYITDDVRSYARRFAAH